MRLRSVWVSAYKNLEDFTLKFDGDAFVDVFVGRNGSGKSNFLEALVLIFDHLIDFGPRAVNPGFDYEIVLQRDGDASTIRWQAGRLSVDGRTRRLRGNIKLPENVLVYYSGQNGSIADLVARYEARFRRSLRGANIANSPAFIGIGPPYRKLLILLLLLLPEDRPARVLLCKKLGILGIGRTVHLTLSRPIVAKRKAYDHFNPEDLFWGLQGITRQFLDDLVATIRDGATPGALHVRNTDLYHLPIDVALFRQVFEGRMGHELFSLFNTLKILGMLQDIALNVSLQGLEISDLSLFSDGQFQSVYLFAIAELFKERDCITLLDEPDAFLHPEWQYEFLKQTQDISDREDPPNHILMTSHSAATLISSIGGRIRYFDVKEGKSRCYSVPKRVAIEKLSNQLMRYSETEQILSIINAIGIEKKPVFFTEGSVDPIIIKEAWYKLYEAEIPFIPFYAFSCSYLRQLMRDDRIFREMGNKPVFGLFDFDQAYNEWNGLKGETIFHDLSQGRCKKISDRNAYAFLMPVPPNEAIRRQVLKDPRGDSHFGGDSQCEIEHLFYGDPRTADFFTEEATPGGGTKIVFEADGRKEAFAREIIPHLDKSYFEVFRPLFQRVTRIIEGKTPS